MLTTSYHTGRLLLILAIICLILLAALAASNVGTLHFIPAVLL